MITLKSIRLSRVFIPRLSLRENDDTNKICSSVVHDGRHELAQYQETRASINKKEAQGFLRASLFALSMSKGIQSRKPSFRAVFCACCARISHCINIYELYYNRNAGY